MEMNEGNEEYPKYSEIVVKEIIEKLISLTITESYNNEITDKIPDHCFQDIKHMMNNMVHAMFIFQDRDDYQGANLEDTFTKRKESDNSVKNCPEDIYFNNRFFGHNSWAEIPEPKKVRVDRAACSLIKVSKSNNSNITINNFSENKNDHIIAETRSNLSVTLLGGQSVNLGTSNQSNQNNRYGQQGAQQGAPRVRSKIEAVELEQKEIENLFKLVEEDFIVNLREEKAREIKKKEEEVKIKLIQEKEKEVVRSENTRKQKEIDGKKVTFDASGNPMTIKNVVVEKLAYDFSWPKFEIKEKGEMTNPVLRTDKSDRDQNISKEINKIVSNANIPKIEEKSQFNKRDQGRRNTGTVKDNTAISNKLKNDYKPIPYMSQMDKNALPIQPAGSNYDLIVPETGVTIIEGAKKKTGDKDFFRKYQKYSKYDYHLMLKESAPQSTLSRLGNTVQPDDLAHSQLSLPHINTSNNLNSFTGVYGNYPGNMLSLSSNNMMSTNKMGHSLNLMESIKLSNKLTMSLKSTLDALDLIPEYEEKIYEEKGEHVNNLGGNIINNRRLGRDQIEKEEKEALETMNKFNYSIIKSAQWGAGLPGQNKGISPAKKHYKPDIKELQKEMGMHVVQTKLPRSRVFNKK